MKIAEIINDCSATNSILQHYTLESTKKFDIILNIRSMYIGITSVILYW